jgi:hypothetical protein
MDPDDKIYTIDEFRCWKVENLDDERRVLSACKLNLPLVGRTNVVVDSVIIFCRSRKTRIFTFFISLEKHLKFIISW